MSTPRSLVPLQMALVDFSGRCHLRALSFWVESSYPQLRTRPLRGELDREQLWGGLGWSLRPTERERRSLATWSYQKRDLSADCPRQMLKESWTTRKRKRI